MEITKLLTNEKALELTESLLQNDKDIRDELRRKKADATYVDEKITILKNEIDTNKYESSAGISNLNIKIDNVMIDADRKIATAKSEMENSKVDKIEGMGLSTNDYTTEEKIKLEGLSNYDDSLLTNKIAILENEMDTNKSASDISISTLDTKIADTKAEINGMQTQLEQLSGDIASAANAEEALLFMSECGLLTPVYQDGIFYTDNNGAIYVL